MPTISMPTYAGFSSWRFGLISNSKAFTSPTNLATQTLEFAGSVWAANYTLPPMKRATAAAWQAFFVKLRGVSGRFYAYDPGGRTARGVATGSPTTSGGSIGATTLATTGWTANQTGILLTGDYFTVSGELHMVVADANSNGSGAATLTFEPPLRTAVSGALTVSEPTCTMRFASPDQAAWDVNHLKLYGLTFSGVEAFV